MPVQGIDGRSSRGSCRCLSRSRPRRFLPLPCWRCWPPCCWRRRLAAGRRPAADAAGGRRRRRAGRPARRCPVPAGVAAAGRPPAGAPEPDSGALVPSAGAPACTSGGAPAPSVAGAGLPARLVAARGAVGRGRLRGGGRLLDGGRLRSGGGRPGAATSWAAAAAGASLTTVICSVVSSVLIGSRDLWHRPPVARGAPVGRCPTSKGGSCDGRQSPCGLCRKVCHTAQEIPSNL